MYSFEKSADEEMIDFIDCEILQQKIQELYKAEGDKLEYKIKKAIKDETKFQILQKHLNLDIHELFFIMAKTYPNIFNHRLIKFIRVTYLNKDE